MNSAKNVVQFIVACFLCLFLLSVIIHIKNINNNSLRNISIVSDIIPKKEVSTNNLTDESQIKDQRLKGLIDTSKKQYTYVKNNFVMPNRLTNYNTDSNAITLPLFVSKLNSISSSQKKNIRVAYLGDSMIEGDLISQTLRKLLQQKFGGKGVGFVPINSVAAFFRQSVKHSFSSNWIESNFKNKITTTSLFLSGRVFNSKGYNWVDYEDKTITTTSQNSINKYLITGYKPTNAQILVNKVYTATSSNKLVNKILVDNSNQTKLKIETTDTQLPFYGVSFETSEGIIVDNFSFRGLAGFEYNAIDTTFLKAINETFQYDLVILHFGVNVLNLPTNNQFTWYANAMTNTIKKLKHCFRNTDFILMGTADKAFKYKNGYSTALGIDSLIAAQQKAAFETNIAFYNTYVSMGGFNSIINWANQKPSLAAKDYTHLSFRGAEAIGTSLYNAILFEYAKLAKNKAQ